MTTITGKAKETQLGVFSGEAQFSCRWVNLTICFAHQSNYVTLLQVHIDIDNDNEVDFILFNSGTLPCFKSFTGRARHHQSN